MNLQQRLLLFAFVAAIVAGVAFYMTGGRNQPEPAGEDSAAPIGKTTSTPADAGAGSGGTAPTPGPANLPQTPEEMEAFVQARIAESQARAEKIAPLLEEARLGAATDPQATLAWALGLDDESRPAALQSLFSEWTRLDPAAAFAAAAGLEDGVDDNTRSRLVAQVLGNWGTSDPAAAWESSQTLPDSATRQAIELHLGHLLASSDLDAAAAAIGRRAQSAEDLQALRPIFGQVASQYARQDRALALEWLEGLPDGPARAAATAGLVGQWMEEDSEAASQWLANQPAGPARDSGVLSLVNSFERTDPEASMVWAATVSDSKLRGPIVTSTASRWLIRSEETATAWIRNSTELSAAEKETIFSQYEQVRSTLEAANRAMEQARAQEPPPPAPEPPTEIITEADKE